MEITEYCLEYLSKSWNQFDKLLGVRFTGMQVKWDPYQDDGTTRESKEEFKDRVFLSPSRCLPNFGDEIHLKGGRIVTPKICLF